MNTPACPKCGTPIFVSPGSDSAICPVCGTAIVFAPAQNTINISGADKMDLQTMLQTAEQFKRIKELVASDKKLEAIKPYREVTGLGLAESKAVIDALEAGQPLVLSQTATRVMTSPVDSDQLKEQIVALVRSNQKIEAVKIYREATNVGLKEAKDAVEAIEAVYAGHTTSTIPLAQSGYQPAVSENPFDPPARPANRAMIFILMVLVLIGLISGVAVLLLLRGG